MELNEKKEREYLINIIQKYLETGKTLMKYYKGVATTKEQKLTCNKSIKDIENSINHLRQIKHLEILKYLYATFIGNNVIAYSVSGKVVLSKKLKEYDTDKGFVEFQEMLKEQREQALEREQKKKESVEALKKAKEMGKKVEMVWDKDTKTVKPMIVEDKNNA